MNNLDIHIVGLGNLGSSLLKGLKNLDNNLTFHLYEKETKIAPDPMARPTRSASNEEIQSSELEEDDK